MTLQPADLDKLAALAREATPGPWHAVVRGGVGSLLDEVTGIGSLRANDAPYIAALSPAVVLELVAAARLGAAWQAAEAAMPEGGMLDMCSEPRQASYRATAIWWNGSRNSKRIKVAATPAAALLSLAEALRERP